MSPQVLGRAPSNIKRFCASVGFRLVLLGLILSRSKDIIFRYGLLVRQLYKFIFGGLPMIIITSSFTGLILAFQTGVQLEQYKQEAIISLLVPITMCREMGPVFTAIAMAGLVGSAVAAEIATMKINEEIDALEVMAIDPISFLALPRFLALLISVPLLTVVADMVGITAGGIIAYLRFDVPLSSYFRDAERILELKDIYGGLLKAVVFGGIIALLALGNGLRARFGAEGVGNATLRTVVSSFLFVLLFDHLLNVFTFN